MITTYLLIIQHGSGEITVFNCETEHLCHRCLERYVRNNWWEVDDRWPKPTDDFVHDYFSYANESYVVLARPVIASEEVMAYAVDTTHIVMPYEWHGVAEDVPSTPART